MRNYRITINGNVYNATVEQVGVHAPVAPVPVAAPPAPIAPVPAPVPVAAAPTPAPVAPPPAPAPVKAAPAPAPVAVGGGTKVDSPMPGTVMKYFVSVGDMVEHHQVLAILEAMKMENEIVAPVSGKVTSIVTPAGSPVNAGDVLLTIE